MLLSIKWLSLPYQDLQCKCMSINHKHVSMSTPLIHFNFLSNVKLKFNLMHSQGLDIRIYIHISVSLYLLSVSCDYWNHLGNESSFFHAPFAHQIPNYDHATRLPFSYIHNIFLCIYKHRLLVNTCANGIIQNVQVMASELFPYNFLQWSTAPIMVVCSVITNFSLSRSACYRHKK